MPTKVINIPNPMEELDQIIHERVRLGIMSCLAARKEMTFNELKEILKVTDGNLSAHSRILEEAKYIKVTKKFEGRKPKTTMCFTSNGQSAFNRYLNSLEAMFRRGKKRDR